MGELTFEERFGELRSALQQEASGAAFEEAIKHVVALMHQAPARFEEQVAPYALAGLERWYEAQPVGLDAGPLVVRRDRALSAIMQRQAWLGVVRGMDLALVRKARVFEALTRGGQALGRLEWLGLSSAARPDGAGVTFLRSELLPRLRALDARMWGGDAWLTACDPALLEQLEALSLAGVSERAAMQVCGLVGLEQVAVEAWSGASGSWLERARWERVRVLRLRAGYQGMDAAARDHLLAKRWPLEELELWCVAMSTAQRVALLEEIGPLRRLVTGRARWSQPLRPGEVEAWPLDAALSGRLGESLESLSLRDVVVRSASACEGGQRLKALELRACGAAVVAYVAGNAARLERLERLTLEVLAMEADEAFARLAGARFARLHTLEIGPLCDGGPLEELARGEVLRGVRRLALGCAEGAGLNVARTLIDREDAFGELEEIYVSYQAHRMVLEQAAGTWLEGRVRYWSRWSL